MSEYWERFQITLLLASSDAPLYFQAWASGDLILQEVSPSHQCPQCRFEDPHGKYACNVFLRLLFMFILHMWPYALDLIPGLPIHILSLLTFLIWQSSFLRLSEGCMYSIHCILFVIQVLLHLTKSTIFLHLLATAVALHTPPFGKCPKLR